MNITRCFAAATSVLAMGALTACQQDAPGGAASTPSLASSVGATTTAPETSPTSAPESSLPSSTVATQMPGTPTAPTATGAPSSASSTTSRPTALTMRGLMSAPYPAMCGNPAGKLVNGKANPAPGHVYANAPGVTSWYNPGAQPLLIDLNGDGRKEMVVEFDCDAGGVSWPTVLVVYGPGWKILGSVNLGTLPSYDQPQRKARVDQWRASGRTVAMTWKTTADSVPNVTWQGRLALIGGKPQIVGVTGGPDDAKPMPTSTATIPAQN